MDASLSFATEIAIHAGKQLLSYFKPNGSYTSVKEDYSVVTEADLVADQFIAESIQKEYPEDALISEELQPTIGEVKSPVWVVDPLDGTTNFSLGMPIWGVSIARVQRGWPVLAVIYFPVFDELFIDGIAVDAAHRLRCDQRVDRERPQRWRAVDQHEVVVRQTAVKMVFQSGRRASVAAGQDLRVLKAAAARQQTQPWRVGFAKRFGERTALHQRMMLGGHPT